MRFLEPLEKNAYTSYANKKLYFSCEKNPSMKYSCSISGCFAIFWTHRYGASRLEAIDTPKPWLWKVLTQKNQQQWRWRAFNLLSSASVKMTQRTRIFARNQSLTSTLKLKLKLYGAIRVIKVTIYIDSDENLRPKKAFPSRQINIVSLHRLKKR
jgi:hypothetical protein